jgi:hypothetical protein
MPGDAVTGKLRLQEGPERVDEVCRRLGDRSSSLGPRGPQDR